MQRITPETALTILLENVNKNISIINIVKHRNYEYILNEEYQSFLFALAENQELYNKLTIFNDTGILQPVLEDMIDPPYSTVDSRWFLKEINEYISSMDDAADALSMLPIITEGGIIDG